MPRYIDADDLDNITVSLDSHGRLKKIEAPVADVQEVKHAFWIENESGYYECSNCESLQPYDGIGFLNPNKATYWDCNYCRCCGAKMDGAVEDIIKKMREEEK